MEELDRDAPLEIRIERGVDDTHAAGAEDAPEPQPAERQDRALRSGVAATRGRRASEPAIGGGHRCRGLGELVIGRRHGSPYIRLLRSRDLAATRSPGGAV